MSLFDRLGLGRPELRGWAFYDWANSAFVTTIVSAMFPPYFADVLSEKVDGVKRLGYGTAVAMAIIAVLAPVIGAIADRAPIKKRMLAAFTLVGAVATVGLATLGPGDWMTALLYFGLANIAANAAFVIYDSLLPHVAKPEELDQVSSAGYALGYVGGGVLLGINAAMVMKPTWFGLADATQAVKASIITVAVWWIAFSIPLFRRVAEPPINRVDRVGGLGILRAGFSDVRHTFAELKRYPEATKLLIAFLIYNDGIGTIFRMATVYGQELNLDTGQMVLALLLVNFIGIPATFAFGSIAGRLGTRRSIFLGLVLYCGISVLGYFIQTTWQFFALAILVGLVQGGTQALSRSLFASMIPRHKSGEFFGLFAVFEKFAGIFGPLLFALMADIFGSSRPAILSVIAFFLIGGGLLSRVDVGIGQATADDANRERARLAG